jgi:hypothetical protein
MYGGGRESVDGRQAEVGVSPAEMSRGSKTSTLAERRATAKESREEQQEGRSTVV